MRIPRDRGTVHVARLYISMPPSLAKYVREIAARDSTSISAVIRDALRLYRRVHAKEEPVVAVSEPLVRRVP